MQWDGKYNHKFIILYATKFTTSLIFKDKLAIFLQFKFKFDTLSEESSGDN